MAETVDDQSVTISFPFHLAANHRIEITVTDVDGEHLVLSDAGRTLGEVEDAGHSLSNEVLERLERLTLASGASIVGGQIIRQSRHVDAGASLQAFLELLKTVGDFYLVHKSRADKGGDYSPKFGSF